MHLTGFKKNQADVNLNEGCLTKKIFSLSGNSRVIFKVTKRVPSFRTMTQIVGSMETSSG